MIDLITALFCEAKPFIEELGLHRNIQETKFQMFENESWRVLVTGAGSIPAAIAVSMFCTKYPPQKRDLLVNIGCAGSASGTPGEIFLIHKITEAATGRTYYPDMLWKSPFSERALITGMQQARQEKLGMYPNSLYDMEAAGVYQAVLPWYDQHRILFLKMLSDHGETMPVGEQEIYVMMKEKCRIICGYLQEIATALVKRDALLSTDVQTSEQMSVQPFEQMPEHHPGRQNGELPEEGLFTEFCCSFVMRRQLEQYLTYAKLAHIDYEAILQKYREEKRIPCRNRTEGKKRIEQFKRKLLS